MVCACQLVTLLSSGKVLWWVADSGNPFEDGNFASAELYDPAANAWNTSSREAVQ
jgi:hypothetical protein